ncbi:MAG: histidine phosphatase family protein [Burkholderiaceae bacterium]
MQRRLALAQLLRLASASAGAAAGLGAGAGMAWASTDAALSARAAQALRQGACAVLIRHAQTESGIGDPPGFRIDLCSTQRNLSAEGREQARRIGDWFRTQQLLPRAVLSSAWCRCRDTAELAFGRHVIWSALNSFFQDQGVDRGRAQAAQMREALARIPAGRFEVWVTHQVNITALTGSWAGMGEAVMVDAKGTIRARLAIA